MIKNISNVFVAVLFATLSLLSACDLTSSSQRTPITHSAGDLNIPRSIQHLLDVRAIDRNALFAEIILRYDNNEIITTANREGTSNTWRANLRIPGNTPYSLEITWYDTADVTRLNLVTFNRNFDSVSETGSQSFDFSDYDFDGYDDDSDGVTNLAEREAGTSPLAANVATTYVVSEQRLVGPDDGFQYIGPGVVELRVSGNDEPGSYRAVVIDSNDIASDFVGAKVTFLDDSVRSANGTSQINLVGTFFNTIADGGPGTNEGDGIINIQLQYNQDGTSRVIFCADVREAGGGRTSLILDGLDDGNGFGCSNSEFSGALLSFEINQELDLEVGVLRESSQIYFQFNGDRRVFDTSFAQFRAAGPRPNLNAHAFGVGSVSHVRVTEFRTETATDTLFTDLQNPNLNVQP